MRFRSGAHARTSCFALRPATGRELFAGSARKRGSTAKTLPRSNPVSLTRPALVNARREAGRGFLREDFVRRVRGRARKADAPLRVDVSRNLTTHRGRFRSPPCRIGSEHRMPRTWSNRPWRKPKSTPFARCSAPSRGRWAGRSGAGARRGRRALAGRGRRQARGRRSRRRARRMVDRPRRRRLARADGLSRRRLLLRLHRQPPANGDRGRTGRGAAHAAVGYRLAPEHPFPAALDDALTAWRFCAAKATRRSRSRSGATARAPISPSPWSGSSSARAKICRAASGSSRPGPISP